MALPVHPAAAAGEGPLLCGHQQLFTDRGLSAGGEHLQLAAGRVGGRAVAAGIFVAGRAAVGDLCGRADSGRAAGAAGRFPAGGELPALPPILLRFAGCAAAAAGVWRAVSAGGHGGGESYAGRPAGDAAPPRLRADHPHVADPADGDGARAHPGVQPEEPVCFCAGDDYLQLICGNGADLHLDYPDGQHFGRAVFGDDLRYL